jgi:FkbM family methyltransferase
MQNHARCYCAAARDDPELQRSDRRAAAREAVLAKALGGRLGMLAADVLKGNMGENYARTLAATLKAYPKRIRERLKERLSNIHHVELVDIEQATEANVPELNFSMFGASVDLIVRHHFNIATVHDPDLALFARAAELTPDVLTFLDIGANVGNTVASLIALGCRFAVHAFEINPSLREHLRHAAKLYGQCTIHPYGLGDAPARMWLYVPVLGDLFVLGEGTLSLGFVQEERHKAQLRSYAPGETLRVGKVSVEIRTLDSASLWADFVKIDVEGVEDRVIKGGWATLQRCKPLIMAENSYPERVSPVLAPLGYNAFNFDPAQGKLRPQEWLQQNTFYVEKQWAGRLQQAGLL